MGQLTLARFRGDTVFALFARLISTLGGVIIGMVMWCVFVFLAEVLLWSCPFRYISSGNPYGLAAVCAVCFPFFFYARLYSPITPMINLIFFVTIILVCVRLIRWPFAELFDVGNWIFVPGFLTGASWFAWIWLHRSLGKTSLWFHCSTLTPLVAPLCACQHWRFCSLVRIESQAKLYVWQRHSHSIVSLLPPSTTIREYQRNLLSTTSSELGSVYCSILSFANTKRESEVQEILSSLIALRNKLKKSTALRANVGYEVSTSSPLQFLLQVLKLWQFSLRGRWPIDRYQKITDLQMWGRSIILHITMLNLWRRAIAYSLSHLISVVRHLEPSWALAFLRRTRFMDPDFQGDLLAVICASSPSSKYSIGILTSGNSDDFFIIKSGSPTSPNHTMPAHWSVHVEIPRTECDSQRGRGRLRASTNPYFWNVEKWAVSVCKILNSAGLYLSISLKQYVLCWHFNGIRNC